MVTIGVGLGAFVAGVLFGDRIKAWFGGKAAALGAKLFRGVDGGK